MCEWTINPENEKDDEPEFYYNTSCLYGGSKIPDETEYYNYCPFCGDPIEIEQKKDEE